MGKPHRRFDKEFEAAAVRLVEMSGRTQREIAEDLGIGLSTLRRRLDKRRERDLESPPPERQEDLAVELKRLRRENGMKARQKRRFKRTTDSPHAFPVAPNLLDQDFTATGPNQKWGADISYVWTREGWLYLAVIIDLFARRVVGWATSDRLHKELALSALRRAVTVRRPAAGLIHHADRGSQYCAIEYQAELRKHGILISMSGKGNCFDNAMVETFFKTLKAELVWRVAFQSRAEATHVIARYIDGFYNPVRRHSALDFISPLQFERLAA